MNTLERLRELSKQGKAKKAKFDDLPDMREDGSIDKFVISDFTKQALDRMQKDAKKSGVKLEAKVIGVTVRVVLLDPRDKTRTNMAFAELVNMHPDIDMKALADMADDIEQIDAEKLNHKCDGECEDEPYEPQSKYDGHMYG